MRLAAYGGTGQFLHDQLIETLLALRGPLAQHSVHILGYPTDCVLEFWGLALHAYILTCDVGIIASVPTVAYTALAASSMLTGGL